VGGGGSPPPSAPTPLFRQRLARPGRGDSLPGGAGKVEPKRDHREKARGFPNSGLGATLALGREFSGPPSASQRLAL
jgi:hypothetical protein